MSTISNTGKHGIHIDTTSLDNINKDMIVFASQVNNAIKSSLRSGIRLSLGEHLQQAYAINGKKAQKSTYRVTQQMVSGTNENALQFAVVGRALTPWHFSMKDNGAGSPTIEIIKGKPQKTALTSIDGKHYRAKVLFKGTSKENIYQWLPTGNNSVGQITFTANGQEVSFMGRRIAKMRAYRTLAVPQMIEHPLVASAIQGQLLDTLDKTLMTRIATQTGLLQENILR